MQIKAIGKYFDLISLDQFTDILDGKKKPARPSALITFDDADSEFTDYALPVLRDASCPAVVFAPTAFVGSDRHLWHLRVTDAIMKTSSDQWEEIQRTLSGLPEKLLRLISELRVEDEENKTHTCRRINWLLNGFEQDVIDSFLEQIEAVVGNDYRLGIACMAWDALRSLPGAGVAVQSHTTNHRKLAQLNRTEIDAELRTSREQLESELDQSVTAICYPAGSVNDDVVELAPEAGYRLGFTGRPGVCRYPLEGPDRYRLPRFGLYGDTAADLHLYLGRIALKRLFRRR